MTSALQNRLVGTIIVVALIVIFVPEFLDGKKRSTSQNFVDVPPVTSLVKVDKTEDFDSEKVEEQLPKSEPISDEIALDQDLNQDLNSTELTETNTNDANTNTNNSEAIQSNSALVSDNTDQIQQENSGDKQAQLASTQNTNELSQSLADDSNANESSAQAQTTAQDTLSQIDIDDAGWVIQLGSFGNKANVKQLVKTLKDAGYRAYTRPIVTASGELTKVFVGPEIEKEVLERALPHLHELTKLKGKITAFEVSAK